MLRYCYPRTMCLRAVVVLLAMLCACCASLHDKCDDCDVVVKISSGPICGAVRTAENVTSYYAFQGIPYAKPPTGARRFSVRFHYLPPTEDSELEKCHPWSKTLLTIKEGPVCPQLDNYYGSIPVHPKAMHEDCLFANVYVPTTARLNSRHCDGKGLPILVNIHGGSYQAGSGNSDLHGPDYFMYKGNMIVITFNYRLAVFGFLSLGSDQIPGNNGLRDMVFFLKWVRENARAFGGNPHSVTIIGQSMGALSAHLLTLSKAAVGLFHRVIMISGLAIPIFYTATPVYASYIAGIFLEAAGINATDPEVIHQQLIEMSLNDIMYANSVAMYATGLTTFVPVVETHHPNFTKIIDADPLTLISRGRGAHIPIIVGFTNNESALARRFLIYWNIVGRVNADPRAVLSPRLIFSLNVTDATERAERVIERYFNGTITMEGILVMLSQSFFVYPTIKLAQIRSAMKAAPLYLYEYSYESLKSMIKRAVWERYTGAAHVEDLTFIFRTNTLLGKYVSFPPHNSDDHMKDWMTNFVINFMHCNNPTCRKDAVSPWPPVNHTLLRLQAIAEPGVYRMEEPSDTYKNMVNFFDTIDPDLGALSENLGIEPF